MPITQSAKKALRQSRRRRLQNLTKTKAMKEAIKAYQRSPSPTLLSAAYQKIDKAAKTNVIATNRAARLKSRLSRLLAAKAQ